MINTSSFRNHFECDRTFQHVFLQNEWFQLRVATTTRQISTTACDQIGKRSGLNAFGITKKLAQTAQLKSNSKIYKRAQASNNP
jgi:hypothetical protein